MLPLVAVVPLFSGCGGNDQPLAQEWIPKLQTEVDTRCNKYDCTDHVRTRMTAMTEEVQEDSAGAGEEFEPVAILAGQVHAAHEHWENDCPGGRTYSAGAEMSCDAALDLLTYADDHLLEAVERADAERRRNQ